MSERICTVYANVYDQFWGLVRTVEVSPGNCVRSQVYQGEFPEGSTYYNNCPRAEEGCLYMRDPELISDGEQCPATVEVPDS